MIHLYVMHGPYGVCLCKHLFPLLALMMCVGLMCASKLNIGILFRPNSLLSDMGGRFLFLSHDEICSCLKYRMDDVNSISVLLHFSMA